LNNEAFQDTGILNLKRIQMANLVGTSSEANIPAVDGNNENHGIGVRGTTKEGTGVVGTSETGVGVWGSSKASSAVGGMAESGAGVHGVSKTGPGVRGDSDTSNGVEGVSKSFSGINGISDTGTGVRGSSPAGTGVVGTSETGVGVWGSSKASSAVGGMAESGAGMHGVSKTGPGVHGESESGVGISGRGGRLAGFFEGDVEVTGDIRLVNADCAEEFEVSGTEKVEAGTVMILSNAGLLQESRQPYDKRVAGVISGAGDYKPGIVLDKQQTAGNRQAIGLLGKVFCKVDAQFGAIEVGDLLTTSPTPGHAMRTSDPLQAFGAVIGKALRPLTQGQGLIPILITMQ
jgi:hypothetical protein